MRLEDLQPRCAVRGVHPDGPVTVVSVQWLGSEALELTYKTPAGSVANELLYRHDETRLEVVAHRRPWSFDGDGALFRLVSEAQRLRLAHLFDPLLAIHTSVVDPLPHWRGTPLTTMGGAAARRVAERRPRDQGRIALRELHGATVLNAHPVGGYVDVDVIPGGVYDDDDDLARSARAPDVRGWTIMSKRSSEFVP